MMAQEIREYLLRWVIPSLTISSDIPNSLFPRIHQRVANHPCSTSVVCQQGDKTVVLCIIRPIRNMICLMSLTNRLYALHRKLSTQEEGQPRLRYQKYRPCCRNHAQWCHPQRNMVKKATNSTVNIKFRVLPVKVSVHSLVKGVDFKLEGETNDFFWKRTQWRSYRHSTSFTQ